MDFFIIFIVGILSGAIVSFYVYKTLGLPLRFKYEYLAAPAICTVLQLAAYLWLGGGNKLYFAACISISFLTGFSIIDIKTRYISLYSIYAFFFVEFVCLLYAGHISFVEGLLGGAIACVVLLLLYALSKGGVGLADVLVFSAVGLLLGIEGTLSALFAAALLCGIFGVGLMCFNKKNINKAIPFIPFVLAGTIVSIFASF